MTQSRPTRPGYKPKSIVLKNGPGRVYRTYEDWLVAQEQDKRTPEQRGIKVGGLVMWRHRNNSIITTDRAMVLAITGSTVTIQVNDMVVRTCDVDVREIVSSDDSRSRDADRRLFADDGSEPPAA